MKTEKEQITVVVEEMRRQMKNAEKVLAKLREDLKDRPVTALEWSDSSFGAAACLQVFTHVVDVLTRTENRVSMADVKLYAIQQMSASTRYPKRSTSMCSNLMAQEESRAWGEVYEFMK